MSWRLHSEYFGYEIFREWDDFEDHGKMSYLARRITGNTVTELFAKNLTGIRKRVREARE